MAPNMDEMRSIIIHDENGVSILDTLSNVSDWKLELLEIPGANKYCLTNGSDKVVLRESAENVVVTVNVLPHDSNHDQVSANKVLKKLSESLKNAGINNSITASEVDLA